VTGVDGFKRHITQLPTERGKKPKFRCSFCKNEYTRYITHFAGVKGKGGAEAQACQKVPDDVCTAAQQLMGETPISGSDDFLYDRAVSWLTVESFCVFFKKLDVPVCLISFKINSFGNQLTACELS